jgi:hypothetical protein
MDRHGNFGRENALTESAQDACFPGPAGGFDDLERRVIGVRRKDEGALR